MVTMPVGKSVAFSSSLPAKSLAWSSSRPSKSLAWSSSRSGKSLARSSSRSGKSLAWTSCGVDVPTGAEIMLSGNYNVMRKSIFVHISISKE